MCVQVSVYVCVHVCKRLLAAKKKNVIRAGSVAPFKNKALGSISRIHAKESWAWW